MKSLSRIQQRLLCLGALLLGIAQAAAPASAAEFVSANGRFRVDMGAEPLEVVRPNGKERVQFQFSATTPEGTKMVTYTDHNESFDDADRLEKHLNGFRVIFTQSLGAEKLEEKSVTQFGRTGYEFQFVSAKLGGSVRWRLFFDDKREYGLMAIGKKDVVDHPRTSAFLDSFAVLTEPQEATTDLLPFIDEPANFATLTFPNVVAIPKERLGESGKQMTAFVARGGKGIYGIVYEQVPGLKSGDSRRVAELTRNALNAMTEGNANKLTQTATRKVKQSGVEATEFEFQAKTASGMLRLRVIVDNERVYSLIVAGERELFETEQPNVFLDAFRLLNSQPVEKKDTATPQPSTRTSAPERSETKKPSNAEKTTREEAIRQLKDI